MPTAARVEGADVVGPDRAAMHVRDVPVNWNSYATAYDLLADHNPEYQALLRDFEAFLATIEPPDTIYDIGGGTGNYAEIAARLCPGSKVRLMEPDAGMIARAQAKMASYANVGFDTVATQDIAADDTADLIVCVHALYTMPAPEQRLVDLHRMLRPGGWLYLIDLGRPMDVADWRSYLFGTLRRQHGLAGALRIFWQGREIAKQNQNILKAQQSGDYWIHSGDELATKVVAAGFEITRQKTVYRGYSDLLVCRAVK